MIDVEEHLAAVLAAVAPTEPVRVPLAQAVGLVTAQDVVSRVDLPGFDNSSMDGYAVWAADVAAAGASEPVVLTVVAEVAAGSVATVPVGPGQAVAIMTGAMLPPGADAVVQVEHTEPAGPHAVAIGRPVPAGTAVRPRGQDVPAGTVVLAAGTRLDPRRVGLLAATGHADVLVHRRPLVAVVSTGSELVPPQGRLADGQIHDANSHLLAAVARELGVEVERHDPVVDDAAALGALLTELAGRCDAVVTSGGVSMGSYDVVKEAFGVTGPGGAGSASVGTMTFVQVDMQPGKPQGLGRLGPRGVPLFALPGNPVSSYVSFEVFVRPALLTMLGVREPDRPRMTARLDSALRSPSRRQYARVVVTATGPGGTGLVAHPVAGQGSHFVADLAGANALAVIPSGVTEVAAGTPVEIWPLGWGSAAGWPSAPAQAADSSGTSARLTHVRADGTAHMVDVSGKDITARIASAAGRVLLSPDAVGAIRQGSVAKGDALAVARIAGLQAVKRTADLVPLAHPIAVHAASVDLTVQDDGVTIEATVRTADRTGIEMEALTAVSIAALALIDMVKAVDRHARVTDVRVTAKAGGRSGDWREEPTP